MLTVISPAKKMDWTPRDIAMTTPDLQEDAVALVKVARELSVGDLQSLMHLSEKLAEPRPFRRVRGKSVPRCCAPRCLCLCW